MANKNNKKAAPAAAPKSEVKKVDNNQVLEQAAKATTVGATSLDRNHQVDLLRIAHETFRMDPNAAAHTKFSPEAVEKINEITALGIATVISNEVAYGNSDFAIKLRATALPIIKELGAQIGVKFDETKFLPSTTEEGVVEAPSAREAVDVSEEAKEALKKDKDIQEKSAGKTFDVNNMDETGLKQALEYYMTTHQGEMIMDNLYKVVKTYKDYYKKVSPDNATNIDNMPMYEVFQKVLEITGRVGILASGIGQYAYVVTAQTGSPAAAFCSLRNASITRDTGEQKFTDLEIADMTKMLIVARANFVITENEKNLASLKASKKPDDEKISITEKNIERAKSVIALANNPSSEYVDKFEENYDSDDQKVRMLTNKTLKSVIDCYRGDISKEKLGIAKKESLLATAKHYIGYITNLFREPTSQLSGYSLGSAPDIVFKTDEELKAEKEAAEKAEKEAAEKKAAEDAKKEKVGKAKSKGKK